MGDIFTDFQLLASELVRGRSDIPCPGDFSPGPHAPIKSRQNIPGRFLTSWDRCLAFVGYFGGGVLVGPVNTPLLKRAYADALTVAPFFAGRLRFAKEDGRLDVCCCNSGARFAVASTSCTAARLRAALGQRPYAQPPPNPWRAFWPPHDLDRLVKEEWPLAAAFVLHLSGGGAVLWVAAHHCCADFESVQTLAAHWAAAYRALLRGTTASPLPPPQPQGPPPSAAAGASARPSVASRPAAPSAGASHGSAGEANASRGVALPYVELLPESRRGPYASADDVEALADAGPPPPGVPARKAEAVPLPWLGHLAVRWYMRWHMQWRGGGVEARTAYVPQARLAELKAQATADLQREQEQKQRDGGEEAKQAPADSAAAHAAATPSARPTAVAPSSASGPAAAADVAWVSTNDALVGRLLQVLHGLPVRRGSELSAFLAADIRRRLAPPLPAGRLGSLMYSTRLEGLRPSQATLGELAAAVRRSIAHHLVPQWRGCLARSSATLAAAGGPQRVVFAFCLEPRATENVFACEGPVNMSRWDVDFALWQFDDSKAPEAFLPMAELGPCVMVVYPGPPDEGGVHVLLSMHRLAWRQLHASVPDLAAAL